MTTTLEAHCPVCGGLYSFALQAIIHQHDCSYYRSTFQREEPSDTIPRVDNVSSLGAQRFKTGARPVDAKPSDAIEAAMQHIRVNGEPAHVIVIFGEEFEGGGTNVRFYQSGGFNSCAQHGMLHLADKLMFDTGNRGPA